MALRPSHTLAQGKAEHCVTRDINDCGEEKVFRVDNNHRVPESLTISSKEVNSTSRFNPHDRMGGDLVVLIVRASARRP